MRKMRKMQKKRERIEEIEKWAAAKEAAWNETVEQLLTWLPSTDMEALLTAHAAERAGRPLTEQELAARQAYAKLLMQKYESSSPRLAWRLEFVPDITFDIVRWIMLSEFTDDQLNLARSGAYSLEQGQPLTESEHAVMQAGARRMLHLLQLADIPHELLNRSECS